MSETRKQNASVLIAAVPILMFFNFNRVSETSKQNAGVLIVAVLILMVLNFNRVSETSKQNAGVLIVAVPILMVLNFKKPGYSKVRTKVLLGDDHVCSCVCKFDSLTLGGHT